MQFYRRFGLVHEPSGEWTLNGNYFCQNWGSSNPDLSTYLRGLPEFNEMIAPAVRRVFLLGFTELECVDARTASCIVFYKSPYGKHRACVDILDIHDTFALTYSPCEPQMHLGCATMHIFFLLPCGTANMVPIDVFRAKNPEYGVIQKICDPFLGTIGECLPGPIAEEVAAPPRLHLKIIVVY